MRRLLPLAALALALVPGAAGASAPRTIGTRGEVVSISADGGTVAIHVATTTSRPCDSGSAWTPSSGKIVRFADEACGKNEAADRHYDSLTLAGSRAAWLDYNFGNHAYCIGPLTASLTQPKARNSNTCPDEPDNEDLYWELKGDGTLLVARSWLQCDSSCGPDFIGSYQDDVTLYSVGTGVKKLAAEKRNTKLLDVDAGRILLRDGGKKQLVVLDAAGKQIGGVPVDAKAALLSGAGQVSVPSGTTLRTYDVTTGQVAETNTMKTGAKLQDVENGLAVYSAAGELHLLTIATNRDRVVATVKGLVQADLEPAGLFYAYNVPGGGAKPGRVAFIAAAALPR